MNMVKSLRGIVLALMATGSVSVFAGNEDTATMAQRCHELHQELEELYTRTEAGEQDCTDVLTRAANDVTDAGVLLLAEKDTAVYKAQHALTYVRYAETIGCRNTADITEVKIQLIQITDWLEAQGLRKKA
ncbi:hypothetical protein Lgee_0442 [Legionella geestiana]|uniref:Uncharacterized protein n=1 Tax=Legionella geestiana TaxID=45065 RepID=A0A0W0U8F4_9GAMM|nr:hypothetical protein [Legionella geestiana]KTD03785.1 hypothetical protein Lgee_0442 [Legionella geestiana]QBS11929.1 hypothetical protein E4T54_03740 [Legionella geestiana]QDQ40458.1 hypothetical protein E3226_008685 [Legionella geestiana]STX53358.1 Uncharacterised protein [Legionella geestiana]